ncbi:SPASM domain-containing protein [Candidatus Woesearchaeota archaeon]|nr:SPASM domain-containing protein [Candidatus Woesearchaeota archaeon]
MKGALISNLKMFYTIKAEKTFCNYKPIQVNIEPTNICNLHCSFCPRDDLQRPKGYMDIEIFKKIIDTNHRFLKESEIHLYVFGESTLHPKIGEMIRHLKEYGLVVQLNTNATILNEERSKILIESGLDKLYFSIDDETDKTQQSYETFMRVRGDRETPQAIAGVLEDTKEDIKPYSNADKIYWSPKHNFAGGINLDTMPDLRNSGLKKRGCYFPFYMLVVDWQGKVTVCCKDYNFRLTIGNAVTETLDAIWNGKRIQSLRKTFFNGNEPDICTGCSDLYIPKFGIKNLMRQIVK